MHQPPDEALDEASFAEWDRVRAAINERMATRAVSQAELVRSAGVDANTVRALQNGRKNNYRKGTLQKVAIALGWEPDAIDVIREGGTPQDLEGPPASAVDRLEDLERRIEHVEQLVIQIAARLGVEP
jgi:DNA-binding Xre family transcriptional regulator